MALQLLLPQIELIFPATKETSINPWRNKVEDVKCGNSRWNHWALKQLNWDTQEVARQAQSELEWYCLLAKSREHQVTVGAGYCQSRTTARGSVENENLSEGFTPCLQIMKTLNVRWMHVIQTERYRMLVTPPPPFFFFFACSETCYRSIKGTREGRLNVIISRWCFIGMAHSICGCPPQRFCH